VSKSRRVHVAWQ